MILWKAIFVKWDAKYLLCCIAVLLTLCSTASNSRADSKTDSFIDQYAQISISGESEGRKGQLFGELLEEAVSYRELNPNNAEAWLATARIRFGVANTQGVLRGPRTMRQSFDDVQSALALDENAMEGFGKAFLGYLYAVLPGWPVGVGDVDKAEKLLGQVVRDDDPNIAFNYFYAMYFIRMQRFEEAHNRLLMARKSNTVLPNYPAIRLLYLNEVEKLLVSVKNELN